MNIANAIKLIFLLVAAVLVIVGAIQLVHLAFVPGGILIAVGLFIAAITTGNINL